MTIAVQHPFLYKYIYFHKNIFYIEQGRREAAWPLDFSRSSRQAVMVEQDRTIAEQKNAAQK